MTDPFVDVRFENAKLAKTTVVLNDLNPQWNESFSVELCHWGANLNFEVRDKDHAYAEYIGAVQLPVSNLVSAGISGNYVTAFIALRGCQCPAEIRYAPVEEFRERFCCFIPLERIHLLCLTRFGY